MEKEIKILYLIIMFTFLLPIVPLALGQETSADTAPQDPDDYAEMSLEQLMNVEIPSTGTLTDTKPRLVPTA
ncbi:MAG: hypothetical protein JW860_11800, partial [Sedimentisphaerales bacterium]|nr:hypothetical protein [Sedimentisphaerales bacterium]